MWLNDIVVKTIQRQISKTERNELERLYSSAQTRKKRFWIMLVGFLAQWLSSMVAIVIIWFILFLVAKNFTNFDFSFQSPIGAMALKAFTLITAIWSALQNWQWFNKGQSMRTIIANDLKQGMIVEEYYKFSAAKCFREPEHGGLMYFLHDENNRTYVLFDYESQNLNVNMKQSTNNQFYPMTNLTVVCAPHSKLIISKEFSGERLLTDNPREITLSPEYWPELDEFCNIKWNDLEQKLCK